MDASLREPDRDGGRCAQLVDQFSDGTVEVGRPVRRFNLTASADSTFPKQYELFAVALADAVAEQLGTKALDAVLDNWLDRLEPYFDARLPEDPDARVEALAKHQSTFGFMASVKSGKGEKLLL